MSQNSSETILYATVAVWLALASTDNNCQQSFVREREVVPYVQYNTNTPANLFCNFSTDNYSRTHSAFLPVDLSSIKKKLRYESILNSFNENNDDFPIEKVSYILLLADAICRLQFSDNISSYNKYTETIECFIKLYSGLTLSISEFICDDIDSPVVFSIHRGEALLVSDELPISQIVNTINSVSNSI